MQTVCHIHATKNKVAPNQCLKDASLPELSFVRTSSRACHALLGTGTGTSHVHLYHLCMIPLHTDRHSTICNTCGPYYVKHQ